MKPEEELMTALSAKVGIIWLQTSDEIRVERAVASVASKLEYTVQHWSCTNGIYAEGTSSGDSNTISLDAALMECTKSEVGRKITVFYDILAFLNDPICLRAARDAHRTLPLLPKPNAKAVVIIDMSPPPLGLPDVTLIEWPLPDREELRGCVATLLSALPQDDDAPEIVTDDIVSAALGLTLSQASLAFARSLAAERKLSVKRISDEKRQAIKNSGLEWHEPDTNGFDAIGGLDLLKDWLTTRQSAFSKKAREYGLPHPKGILLAGVPGSGKSLTAKAVAAAWNLPLLRMDVGALFSKWVGESETQIKRALQTAETVAPCVLWIDEIVFRSRNLAICWNA